MALVSTQGLWLPGHPYMAMPPANIVTTVNINGDRVAWIGRVWTPDRGSKSIRNISWRFGSVTKAGGSTLIASLQDTDLANGPPFRPDGTQDQTYTILNADANFVTSAFYTTGNLSADRSVSFGDRISVVLEFATFGGADSFSVNNPGNSSSTIRPAGTGVVKETLGTTWTDQAAVPNVLFTFSDGTFGTLFNCLPHTNVTAGASFNSGSTPDERALEFKVPFDCKVEGVWSYLTIASGADVDLVLYDASSNVLGTYSLDSNAINAATTDFLVINGPEVLLTRNTTYRLAIKPTTTNNVTDTEMAVAAANHFSTWPGGIEWKLATRTDAGAWSTTTTQRPFAGIIVSAINDTASSGVVLGG